MKKLFIPVISLAVLSSMPTVVTAQYFSDKVLTEATEITTNSAMPEPAYFEADDDDEKSKYGNFASSVTMPDASEVADNSSLSEASNQFANGLSNPAAKPGQTLDAPPDCPECVPDPTGDVVDVPFDKRLLFILFIGVVIIAVKVYSVQKPSPLKKGEIDSDEGIVVIESLQHA